MGITCNPSTNNFKIPKKPLKLSPETGTFSKKGQSIEVIKKQKLPVANPIYEKKNIGVIYDKYDEEVEYLDIKLMLKDFTGNSFDSYSIKVEIANEMDNKKVHLGTTKSEPYSHEIHYSNIFSFSYNFSVMQYFKFTIIKNNIVDICSFIKSINKLYANQNLRLIIAIPNPLSGKLCIQANTMSITDSQNFNLEVQFEFNTEFNVKRKFLPFYIIKQNPIDSESLNPDLFTETVYKSEVISNPSVECKFKPFLTNPKVICFEKMKKYTLVELHDFPNQRLVGYFFFKLGDILNGNTESRYSLTYVDPEDGEEVVVKGVLATFKYSKVKKKNTFLDYVKGGLKLAMIIGIDYTSSNGAPNEEKSLHTLLVHPNYYEQVLKSCQEVISAYDSDQIFQVYGFGGLLKNQKEVSHCFNINFGKTPNIEKIENVLKAYRKSLTNVTFSGPTFFAPLINKAVQSMKQELMEKTQQYSVLLMLTDGIINDMEQTKDAIVEGSFYPLSILIVGIGTADFNNMNELDANLNLLKTNSGKEACRDCVVFKKFEEFKDNKGDMLGHKLAEELMKDIPKHIEEFHTYLNINPGGNLLNIFNGNQFI